MIDTARTGSEPAHHAGKTPPVGRKGTPADIAKTALSLLSNESAGYVTGEVLAVDGGLDLFNWIERP